MMMSFSNLQTNEKISQIDDIMGHMSYPIYLSHYSCAYGVLLASKYFGIDSMIGTMDELGRYHYSLLGASTIIITTMIIGLIIAVSFEFRMDRFRHKVSAAVTSYLKRKNTLVEMGDVKE